MSRRFSSCVIDRLLLTFTRNTRRRPCDKVYPQNIDTTGLTDLVFSFATIDPKTFTVGPMHPDDEKLYTDFLSLQDGSKKWIGIGKSNITANCG